MKSFSMVTVKSAARAQEVNRKSRETRKRIIVSKRVEKVKRRKWMSGEMIFITRRKTLNRATQNPSIIKFD